MRLWDWIASKAGDTWVSWRIMALWPYPAILVGKQTVRFTWADYRRFAKRLKPGDMLLTRSAPFFASNAGISGCAFKHCAVYTGTVRGFFNPGTKLIDEPEYISNVTMIANEEAHERTICHAISEGVVCEDLGELLFHSDYVMAVRPWRNVQEQVAIMQHAICQVGKPYDFDFNQVKDDRIFCTELGRNCCLKAGIAPPIVSKKKLYLLKPPMDVTLADDFTRFQPVVCSESCLDEGFQAKSRLGGEFHHSIMEAWRHGIIG